MRWYWTVLITLAAVGGVLRLIYKFFMWLRRKDVF